MSDKEAAAWATFKTQAQTGSDGQPKKKAKKPATGDRTQASTGQASAPDVSAASIAQALSWQSIVGLAVVLIALLWGLVWIFRRIFRAFGSKDSDGFAKADYKIPHCKHEKTADGFIVTFSRWPSWLDKLDPANRSPILGIILLIPFVIGILYFVIKSLFKHTRIEATSNAVIVDGKKFRRSDFGNFFIAETVRTHRDPEYSYALIGYNYGRQRIKMPYLWREDQATDFLAALNNDMRRMPLEGDKSQPSPEDLRNAGQTDVF